MKGNKMSKVENLFVNENLQERRKLIADICKQSPMFDVIATSVNKRRLIIQNGHWLADFGTQSYLGFDFDESVMNAAIQGIRQYGVVVAWCRLVATVGVFDQVEKEIAKLVGTEACSIFASTTLLNHGVIPALAGKDGIIFLDKSAHATMYEGAKIARDSGATLVTFPQDDFEELEKLLQQYQHVTKKLILTDGVYSMTGEYANLPEFDRLARQYNALVFVDDAHGFGVVGENPSKEVPYGYKGNGLIRYFGLNFDNMVYVGCFSKAYGSFGSFIACSQKLRDFLLSQATPHDLGGVGPAATMSAVAQGLKINQEHGQAIRLRISQLTQKTVQSLKKLGYQIHNTSGFPIISVWLGSSEHIIEVSQILYDNHVLLTLAPYPMVRKGEESLRITVTASNTEEEINQLVDAFIVLKPFLQKKGYLFQEKKEAQKYKTF